MLILGRFQGTSSPQPSNVPIESGVSERLEMAASGSVAWTASPDKSNASSTRSVRLSLPSPRRKWFDRMLTPTRYINLTGINGESSFERDLLLRAPGCEAWGYDYSVGGVRVPCLLSWALPDLPL